MFPAGTAMPKLIFAVLIPAAEQFRQMRVGVAAQDQATPRRNSSVNCQVSVVGRWPAAP